jgi:tetratricopeptide (TPR) repeat protein
MRLTARPGASAENSSIGRAALRNWAGFGDLTPILFGPEPTARARAWIDRHRWVKAEAAFDEAALARPFDADIVLERARFHAARSRPERADNDFVQAYALGSRKLELIETILRSEVLFHRVVAQTPDSAASLWSQRGDSRARQQRWAEAAADYDQAVRLQPEELWRRQRQILSHAAAGELDQLQRARSDLLDRFGRMTDPGTANTVAWYGSLAPGVDARLEALVRLAELAVNGAPAAQSNADNSVPAAYQNTLGAALYRAGRFEEAIRRLEEGIKLQNGPSLPQDWVFLAMAHHRLGHRDQAHRYLESLRSRQTGAERDQSWTVLEIRLLRSEAEAVILYDPIFPADPFAH